MIGGSLKRTYYFTISDIMVTKANGTLGNGTRYPDWDPLRYNLIPWSDAISDAYRYFFTGTANMYTIYDIPENVSKQFGFREYTVIRLDWPGMVRLFSLGHFANQQRCINEDCGKYSYYRPVSITVEFIPKYQRPLSKVTGFMPTSVTLPDIGLRQGTASSNVPGWHGVIESDTALTIGPTNFLRANSDASITNEPVNIMDVDAMSRVGYIVPAIGDTAADLTAAHSSTDNASFWTQQYNSMFSTMNLVPTVDFLSSFKRAPYKRARIVPGKRVSFTYKLGLISDSGTFYPGSFNTHNDVRYINDCAYLYIAHSSNMPFDHIYDNVPDHWMRADVQVLGIPRVYKDNADAWDATRSPFLACYHEYQPLQFANIFIPDMNLTTLWRFFNIRFKYKCIYRAKTFDLE